MNPKKPIEEKAKNAGISLEPELTRKAKALAKKRGLKSLSAFTHQLLTSVIQEAEEAGERLEESGKDDLKKAAKPVKYSAKRAEKK